MGNIILKTKGILENAIFNNCIIGIDRDATDVRIANCEFAESSKWHFLKAKEKRDKRK